MRIYHFLSGRVGRCVGAGG